MCLCSRGTLSSATPFVSEVVRLLPMRERRPLYTTFIFYTPVCAFMWHFVTRTNLSFFFFLSVQHESCCTASVELYIIPSSPRPASSRVLWQMGRSFFTWSAATHFHVPTLLPSPRESRCCKSQLHSKAPCVSITLVRVGELVSSPQNLPVVL